MPGAYPFTRGVYPSMYRGRLWTMRQFAGFGTAIETNERFRYLLEHGQTGLSTAFDMPSLMGHDSDSPLSLGEVGREGVAIDTLDDMQDLFAGIDLGGRVGVADDQRTGRDHARVLRRRRRAAGACRQSGCRARSRPTSSRSTSPRRSGASRSTTAVRLQGDMMEWCTRHVPRWHPVSISGYHIREAGATAAQELAFTLKNGLTYVAEQVARGLDVDSFAPRLSFFFNAQIDFFEEIAKYRAARRIWARELRETYGAREERSLLMRFHTQTAGVSLTAQQPLNNITRTAIEALAGVLGGTQSLHTNSYDEALALPTEEAVQVALRTQQIIAHETGVTNTIDPLGGSYFVEALTDRIEAPGLRVLPPHRRARRHGRGRQARLPPAGDRRCRVRAAAAHRRRRAGRRRRQQPPDRGRAGRSRRCASIPRSNGARSSACTRRARGATARPSRRASRGCARSPPAPEHDGGAARRDPRARDRGRDRRGAAGRLGTLPGDAGVLVEVGTCTDPPRAGPCTDPQRVGACTHPNGYSVMSASPLSPLSAPPASPPASPPRPARRVPAP